MSILQHPALRAVGDIVAAVLDTLIGGPLNLAMTLRANWAVVLFAVVVYGIIGAAIFHLFGPKGIAGACALFAIWCVTSKKSVLRSAKDERPGTRVVLGSSWDSGPSRGRRRG